MRSICSVPLQVPLPAPPSQEGSASGGGAAAPSKRARLASLASTAVDFAAWALGSLLPRRP